MDQKVLTQIFNNIELDHTFFDPNYAWIDVEGGLLVKESGSVKNEKTENQSYWKDIFQFMEAALSNGIVWEIEPQEIPVKNEKEQEYYQTALQSLAIEMEKMEEILAMFDNWTGTSVDILSPYGDINWGEDIFAEEDLTFEIPVRVYRKDSDYVIKANMPWIKIGEFNDMPLDPRINLKSVLAALPLRINSRQAKISFVNGELKVEVPEVAEK